MVSTESRVGFPRYTATEELQESFAACSASGGGESYLHSFSREEFVQRRRAPGLLSFLPGFDPLGYT